MFAFNRSAIGVLAPLALLVAVVLWSHLQTREAATYAVSLQGGSQQSSDRDQAGPAAPGDQTVAANLPSR